MLISSRSASENGILTYPCSYPKQMTNEVKTRLSNSILIGDIFGMLIFGLCIDKFGRKVGIILTTLFLVLVRTPRHNDTVVLRLLTSSRVL